MVLFVANGNSLVKSSQSSQLVPRWPSFAGRKMFIFREVSRTQHYHCNAGHSFYILLYYTRYVHAHNNIMWCILLLLMVCSTVQGMFRENAYVRIKTEQYRLRLNCRFRGIRTCTLRAYLSNHVHNIYALYAYKRTTYILLNRYYYFTILCAAYTVRTTIITAGDNILISTKYDIIIIII